MKPLVAIAVCLALAGSLGWADQPRGVRWQDLALEQALAEARKTDRLVLVDCWATWCAYCFVMDRETWALDDLARVVNSETIPIKKEVDVERGVGLDLRLRYQVGGLPAVLFLHPEDGRLLLHLEGYQSAEKIIEALDQARLLAWPDRQSVAAAEDPESLLRLAGQLHRSGDSGAGERALDLARKVWQTDQDCQADRGDDAALLMADILQRAGRSREALEALAAASEPCLKSTGIHELWQRMVELHRLTDAGAKLGQVLARRTELFPDQIESWLDYAAWLSESGAAEQRSLEVLEIARTLDAEDTRVLAALAQHYAGTGDSDRAIELIEDAIRIDPHDPELREIRLRLVLASR